MKIKPLFLIGLIIIMINSLPNLSGIARQSFQANSLLITELISNPIENQTESHPNTPLNPIVDPINLDEEILIEANKDNITEETRLEFMQEFLAYHFLNYSAIQYNQTLNESFWEYQLNLTANTEEELYTILSTYQTFITQYNLSQIIGSTYQFVEGYSYQTPYVYSNNLNWSNLIKRNTDLQVAYHRYNQDENWMCVVMLNGSQNNTSNITSIQLTIPMNSIIQWGYQGGSSLSLFYAQSNHSITNLTDINEISPSIERIEFDPIIYLNPTNSYAWCSLNWTQYKGKYTINLTQTQYPKWFEGLNQLIDKSSITLGFIPKEVMQISGRDFGNLSLTTNLPYNASYPLNCSISNIKPIFENNQWTTNLTLSARWAV